MSKVTYLVMDVDGTLTDGKIYMGSHGEVCKAFDAKDGYGICKILMPAGIVPVIITGRNSQIVKNRCVELGITLLFQNVADKVACLNKFLGSDPDYSAVAYIGDDLNDLPCMQMVKAGGGVIGCPADAVKEIREIADFVSTKNGGQGAVREFIELLCQHDTQR